MKVKIGRTLNNSVFVHLKAFNKMCGIIVVSIISVVLGINVVREWIYYES